MSTPTINLKLHFCTWRFTEGVRNASLSLAMAAARLDLTFARSKNPAAGAAARFRREQERRLAAARKLAETDPHIDIQIVSFNGACHVIVRRLGGWDCGHRDCAAKRLARKPPLVGAGADNSREEAREQIPGGGAGRRPVSADSGEAGSSPTERGAPSPGAVVSPTPESKEAK